MLKQLAKHCGFDIFEVPSVQTRQHPKSLSLLVQNDTRIEQLKVVLMMYVRDKNW